MQKLCRRLRRLPAIAISLLCILGPTQSAGAAEIKIPFPLQEAQQFLRQLYPELDGKGYVTTVELGAAFDVDWTSMPRFSVEVGSVERGHKQYGLDQSAKSHLLSQESMLDALFEFAPDGKLQAVHIDSRRILSDTQNQRLRAFVDSHRHWSDTQLIAKLKKLGAKFSPGDKEAFLNSLPFETLQPFIGKVQVESAEFRLRHQQPSGSSALLYWEVDVVSQEPSGNPAHWTLIFEPVGGRLSSVVRYFSDK